MKKKKQHKIPICYLENFTDDDGKLHVLDLKNKKIFETKPENILTDNHFYTIKFPQGGGSLVVENTLEKIESKYTTIFHNKIKRIKPLDIEEKALMSVFVAAIYLRTEAFRKSIETPFGKIEEFIKKIENLSKEEKKTLASIPSLPPSGPTISGEEFKKVAKDIPSFHSTSIVEMLPEVSNIIFNMKWGFLISENKENCFISSDDPCVLMNVPAIKKYGINTFGSSPGLLQDNVDLSLPLSSQISLLAGWKLKKEAYISVPSKMIYQINLRVMMHAREKIIARSDKKLKEIFSILKKSSKKITILNNFKFFGFIG
ncbi:MAG: DUF4238 domain-containing protein [Promethearchaeota archaeon]